VNASPQSQTQDPAAADYEPALGNSCGGRKAAIFALAFDLVLELARFRKEQKSLVQTRV
jgi:hypothetical protein